MLQLTGRPLGGHLSEVECFEVFLHFDVILLVISSTFYEQYNLSVLTVALNTNQATKCCNFSIFILEFVMQKIVTCVWQFLLNALLVGLEKRLLHLESFQTVIEFKVFILIELIQLIVDSRLVRKAGNICYFVLAYSGCGTCHVKLPRSILISLILISLVVCFDSMIHCLKCNRYWCGMYISLLRFFCLLITLDFALLYHF